MADQHERRRANAPAPAPAIRWPAGRDGWSARPAAGCRARAPARGPAPRGAPRRPTGAPGPPRPVRPSSSSSSRRTVGVVGRAEAGFDIVQTVVAKPPKVRAPAAGSAGWRRAAGSGVPASGLDRPGGDLAAASTCRSRCGRRGEPLAGPDRQVGARRAAACRRRSGGCLGAAEAEGPCGGKGGARPRRVKPPTRGCRCQVAAVGSMSTTGGRAVESQTRRQISSGSST